MCHLGQGCKHVIIIIITAALEVPNIDRYRYNVFFAIVVNSSIRLKCLVYNVYLSQPEASFLFLQFATQKQHTEWILRASL